MDKVIQLESYSAGSLQKSVGYQYFLPSTINAQWQWDTPEINMLLEKAAVQLGALNSFARIVPNIDVFIQLHVTKEAVVSSKIEGTQTNMDEALLPEEEVEKERRNDWREVNNYIKALNTAIKDLETLPISSRLLRKAHEILLDDVRGEHKMPGNFRTSQNWIGGHSIADAPFIPPHQDFVQELMGDLENFLHKDSIKVPGLIKIAIAHYQFETIHPFLDGNGRIGRLLITLFLVSEKILEKPLLYLSTFFEDNKALYYDNLTRVRTHNSMIQWIKYFLVGLEKTAAQAVETLTQVLDLKNKVETQIQSSMGRRSGTAMQLLQELFTHPFTTVERASKTCDLSYKAANSLVSSMEELGILKEVTGQSRNRMYIFKNYVDLFRN
jgi:Fic family protein